MISRSPAVPIRERVPLSSLTTLGVGGPARYLAACATVRQLQDCLDWASTRGLEVFVLGGGSNLLVADAGFDGLVIQVKARSVATTPHRDGVLVTAGGGMAWDDLVQWAVERDLGGIECLSGIPGTTGAAPVQNIGAYGQEVAETLEWVDVVAVSTGQETRLDAAACGLGYRTSHFKTRWRSRFIVTRIGLRLEPHAAPTVRYGALAQRLKESAALSRWTLTRVRDEVLALRRSRSMLLDPDDPNSRSAGSFFTNPVVPRAVADQVRAEVARGSRTGRPLPEFAAAPGMVKLSAAYLIEEAGFSRGHRAGRAGLSTRHALALINLDGATASELVALAIRIRDAVLKRFGVALVPEPHLLGFDDETLHQLGLRP